MLLRLILFTLGSMSCGGGDGERLREPLAFDGETSTPRSLGRGKFGKSATIL